MSISFQDALEFFENQIRNNQINEEELLQQNIDNMTDQERILEKEKKKKEENIFQIEMMSRNSKEPNKSTKESLKKYIQSDEDAEILENANNKIREICLNQNKDKDEPPTKEEIISYFKKNKT